VAMMADAVPAGALKTFTIGFSEQSFDESSHARRVARHFGTDHHEDVFTTDVMIDLLPSVVDLLDEPFADASILPTYLLSRFTRASVTVALGGDGSDELLAGYPTFVAERLARLYRIPRPVHERLVVPLAAKLPVSTANFSRDFKIKRFLRGASATDADRHATWLGAFTLAEQETLLARPVADPLVEQRAAFQRARTRDNLERLIYLYAATYLTDDILFKVDRASMANSLEVRAPFLDVELVDVLGSIPASLKLRRFDTKWILKRAMGGLLPAGIVARPKKGFGIPIGQWFKEGLRDQLLAELSASRLRAQGIFDPTAVERLVAEHLSGRFDHRKQLWTLLMFQLWHRRWMEEPSRATNFRERPSSSRPIPATS